MNLNTLTRTEVSDKRKQDRYVLGEIVLNDIADADTVEIVYKYVNRDKTSDLYGDIAYFVSDNKNGNVKRWILEDIASASLPRDTHGTSRRAKTALGALDGKK